MRRKKALICLVSAFLLLVFLLTESLAAFAPVWPALSGLVMEDGNLTVDAGSASKGYLMIAGPATSKRLKLRIVFDDQTLTYDLNSDGNFEVFPLQFGSGTYTCSLYKNVQGNKYSSEGSVKIKASLEREDAAFLCPSQYVKYDQNSKAVAKSVELCSDLITDEEKFEKITSYVKQCFVYDYVRSVTISTGALPDIEYCFSKNMGVCQDLAAMTACMLRVQGIPAKLMIGYADKNYHAWLIATVNGEEKFFDPTAELNAISKTATYTVERFY